jgi:glycerophosphoryl diester phosphodiesterase
MKLITSIAFSVLCSAVVAQTIDIGGNRGFRGMYPENSIQAFTRAVKIGVNTIEMDVVISKDKQVVVSHELTIDENICNKPDGAAMTAGDKDKYKIYAMNYEEIKKFDCGSRGNSRFTDQVKNTANIPLLKDVIDAVEKYIKDNDLPPVNYNIQIVSSKKGDEVMHPEPPQFSKLVYDVVSGKGILARTLFSSFDMRVLQDLHKIDGSAMTALLSDKNTDDLETNLKDLHFNPTVYSPAFLLVTKAMISKCHSLGIRVITWAPNEMSKMIVLKNEGVDGIITDYPDRAIRALRPK